MVDGIGIASSVGRARPEGRGAVEAGGPPPTTSGESVWSRVRTPRSLSILSTRRRTGIEPAREFVE
jgi:hypothetical protein